MTFPALTKRRCCDIHDSCCHKHTCHKHTLGAVICCHAICQSAVRRLNSDLFTCTLKMVTGTSGLWAGIVRDTCAFAHCIIQMEVMGLPGIFGRLHLTSRMFHTATALVMCTESTEKRGLTCNGTPTLSQKHTLNFDPFALFKSVQRIVGKNSLRRLHCAYCSRTDFLLCWLAGVWNASCL